jgi:Flp pilus assembly protein TadB
MIQTLRSISPFLCALTIGWFAFYLVKNLRLQPKVGRLLEDFYASAGNTHVPTSRSEQIGDRIAQRLPISFDPWEANLKWAQRGGYFKGWGIGRLVFMAFVYGGLGACALIANPAPISLLIPILAAAYPFFSVRAKANTVRKRVIRSLPELATLVAAEMAAGVSPDQALQRAAALTGPVSGLLSDVFAYSRSTGCPLFGRKPVHGALVEVFSQANLPELTSFSVQLDLVAEKGVSGSLLMSEVARTLSREYRSRLDSEVEKLKGRLMLATAVFFFIPFVLIILGSFIAPVMAIFG